MPIALDSTGIDNALIGEIVRRILSVAKPDKIILFGSAATGQMTRDSDIDLLIVERQRKPDLVFRALRGSGPGSYAESTI